MSLNDQPGEFCNGILSSVGSEIVVSHRTCSDSVFKPSPDAHALSTSRASFNYRSWWIMNRKSLKQPASTQDRTDQPTGLMNATGCRCEHWPPLTRPRNGTAGAPRIRTPQRSEEPIAVARSGEGHPVYEPFTLQTTIADRIVGIRRIGGMIHVVLDEA